MHTFRNVSSASAWIWIDSFSSAAGATPRAGDRVGSDCNPAFLPFVSLQPPSFQLDVNHSDLDSAVLLFVVTCTATCKALTAYAVDQVSEALSLAVRTKGNATVAARRFVSFTAGSIAVVAMRQVLCNIAFIQLGLARR